MSSLSIDLMFISCFACTPTSLVDEEEEYNVVKATPKSKTLPDGRFDTVIVLYTDDAESTGIQGNFIVCTLIKIYPYLII